MYFIELHPLSILINHPDDDTTTSPVYLYLTTPRYVPRVRCVDAEEVEQGAPLYVDAAMINSLSDDCGENIELQNLDDKKPLDP